MDPTLGFDALKIESKQKRSALSMKKLVGWSLLVHTISVYRSFCWWFRVMLTNYIEEYDCWLQNGTLNIDLLLVVLVWCLTNYIEECGCWLQMGQHLVYRDWLEDNKPMGSLLSCLTVCLHNEWKFKILFDKIVFMFYIINRLRG